MKWITINDMYKYSKLHNIPLLSEFEADFWGSYTSNYQHYDSLFRRLYSSFRYCMQSPYDDCHIITDSEIENLVTEFEYDVYNHLMLNSKKYSELYRINVINDNDYNLLQSYKTTETMQRDTEDNDSNVYGARTDTTRNSIGAKTDTTTNTIGSKVITESEQIGQRQDSANNNIGARTDNNETVTGAQENTGTNTIAGFNSSDFENDRQIIDNTGARTDTSQTVVGAQQNTSTNTIGAQSNSKSTEHGAQNNTNSTQYGARIDSSEDVKGAQTDTRSSTRSEEYTLTKEGLNGNKTYSDLIKEHIDVWSLWEFYAFIFSEINSQLLLV